MTLERKCFVAPEDILSIRLTCGQCGSALAIPIATLEHRDISAIMLKACPYCGAASGFSPQTREWEDIVQFNILLSRLVGTTNGRNLRYSFEIECPS